MPIPCQPQAGLQLPGKAALRVEKGSDGGGRIHYELYIALRLLECQLFCGSANLFSQHIVAVFVWADRLAVHLDQPFYCSVVEWRLYHD